MKRLLLTLACLLFVASTAGATDYYVDNHCANNGTGAFNGGTCAASGGAAGPKNDLQSALDAATSPDDNVIVRNNGGGDYVTTFGTGYSSPVGFRFKASGTSGHPITLKNYPGERPVLRPCVSGSTTLAACDRMTVSAHNLSYTVMTSDSCPTTGGGNMGFHVYGGVVWYDDAGPSESDMALGNKLSCVEAERGYTTAGDGNWVTLWAEGQYGFETHHFYFHDIEIASLSGSGPQNGQSGIVTFETSNSSFYRGTIRDVEESSAGGFNCKADCINNQFYENSVTNVTVAWRIQNQYTTGGPYDNVPASGTVFRNNLLVSGSPTVRPAIMPLDGQITGWTAYNNTFVGFTSIVGETDHNSGVNPCQGGSFYNNALVTPSSQHYELGDGSGISCTLVAPSDYNYFTTGQTFKYSNTGYGSFALWKASSPATSGPFDQNSTAVAAASFLFTNAGAGDYTLQGGSPLVNAGHVGGVSGGAAINVGAYTAAVTCVGYTCGSAAAPAPTVTSITPNSGSTAGGTSVTVGGTDFDTATAVITIGGVTCTRGGGGATSTSLPCSTGAHAAATVDVVVTNGDAQAGTLTNGYTYTSPPPATVYRIRAARSKLP